MSLRFAVLAIFLASSAAQKGKKGNSAFCANGPRYEPTEAGKNALTSEFHEAIEGLGRNVSMDWVYDLAYEAQLCFEVPIWECVPVYYELHSTPELVAAMATITYMDKLTQCDGHFGCACWDNPEKKYHSAQNNLGMLFCFFLPKNAPVFGNKRYNFEGNVVKIEELKREKKEKEEEIGVEGIWKDIDAFPTRA